MINWIKKEIVLCVSIVLACISMCLVQPDRQYVTYIDWNVLGILFGLMLVVGVFRQQKVLDWIAEKMLMKTGNIRQLMIVLVGICFVSSMFITNDVALITFVPFGILIWKKSGKEQYAVLCIVMQTIAANLGSSLTPIGNPQNLYLYELANENGNMSLMQFMGIMTPYVIVAAVVLGIMIRMTQQSEVTFQMAQTKVTGKPWEIVLYMMCFGACLLTVLHVIPMYVALLIVVICTIWRMPNAFKLADYSLLATFFFFFIFVGNMKRIPQVSAFMEDILQGREVWCGIGLSQIISNMPAAMLLSGFTTNIKDLVVGVNLGGLGTLIASMATLISYKCIAREMESEKGKFVKVFTKYSIGFLGVLVIVTFMCE